MNRTILMSKLLQIEGNLHLLKSSIIIDEMTKAALHFEVIEMIMKEIREDAIGKQYSSSKFYLAK